MILMTDLIDIYALLPENIFCQIRNESISEQEVEATMKYDREFQPPRQYGYDVSTNETRSKKVRQTFFGIF